MPAAIPKHELPNRVRFSLPCLRRDNPRATVLCVRLAALPGVAAAEVSALTGSVLVAYDGHAATREQVAELVGCCDRTPAPCVPAPRVSASGLPAWAPGPHPVLRALVEKLLEHALGAAIAAMI